MTRPSDSDVRVVRTHCNRDCPDVCGILAEVRDGRIERLRGDPDHPVTRGFLCKRTSRFLGRQYHPDRLTVPLLRIGGELRPVSFEEALDFIATRLLAIREESGPGAILHYRSGGSLGILKAVVDVFFDRFGPCAAKRGDICSGAGDAAQELDFGTLAAHDVFDLHHARHVLNWGKNLHVSNVHLLPVVAEARRRGATYTVVDPVATRSARDADHHVAVRPGGDFALAAGVGRVLLDGGHVPAGAAARCEGLEGFAALCRRRTVESWAEEADVPVGEVHRIASCLADGPTAILVGWGLQRRSNGGATVRMLDALCAISGNLGVPGGGASFDYGRRSAFDTTFGCGEPSRWFDEPVLGAQLLAADPPVRAVWVTAGNPVAMLPDSDTVARAFAETELVVVVDSFLTDTARRATVVLPCATLLEDDDVLGSYGHHWLSRSTPVVPPPGEARTDLAIIQALAERVGLGDQLAGSVDDWVRRALRPGVTPEQLARGPVRNPAAPRVPFSPDEPLPTPSGRVRLVQETPPQSSADPDYPLWLMSSSTADSQSSQWIEEPRGRMPVRVHPDATTVADGQRARLVSALGALEVVVRHDASLRDDLAVVPKGGALDSGWCANRLVAASPTDIGLGACYLDARVGIEAVDPDSKSNIVG